MLGLETCDERFRVSEAFVSQQFWQKQTSAHPNRTMDSPLRYAESSRAQSLVPSGHMLIDAIDERSIEVENNPRCFQEFSKQKKGTVLRGPQDR
jgi:hypothetical protein